MNKQIDAKIQLASLNKETGDVLSTFILTYPRIILPEILTHRKISRSTASSRATPARRIRGQVLEDPFVPSYIDKNVRGMQGGEPLTGGALAKAKAIYKYARIPACGAHWLMEKVGVHKQITNRLLEPWVWVEQVVSATEWDNFFKLRTHWMAEPHFQELAKKMMSAQVAAHLHLAKMLSLGITREGDAWGDSAIENKAVKNLAILKPGDWHLPFCESMMNSKEQNVGKIVSTARCARVSYYLKDGALSDYQSDLALYNRLCESDPKHLSPLEHPAQAIPGKWANFTGFRQHRWGIEASQSK